MSRDPFEQMKNLNPVPSDQAPAAPMSVANRIMGRDRVRRGWPGWAVAMTTAVFVLVAGGGMYWWLSGGTAEVAASSSTTTTVAPTTSTTAVPTETTDGVIYLFADQTSPGWTGGPYLIPVARHLTGADPVTDAVVALLAGPTSDEAGQTPAFSSAIPTGTMLHEVTVADGVASVDLSTEFTSGGGSASMTGRLAQVVFTLTRLDGIHGVRFLVDGTPTTVFGGEGVIVGDPATRADFPDAEPAVMIDSPAWDGVGGNPLVVSGTANVFEASVSLALTDSDGLILWEGNAMATCGTGCRGDWSVSIPYAVDSPQWGSVIAWEASAMDGSQTNVREHRVWLTPSDGSMTTCSAVNATALELAEQAGLPDAVQATRSAIWAAATACDWDTLRGLLAPGFSYTFGEDTDAIAYWQGLEASGDDPIYFLVELLSRPFGTMPGPDGGTYYVWPSAFNQSGWQDVPQADVEALRPLYGDVDFAGFAEFGGYYGYRVGILDDGSWVFFVAGD